jgi:hypothetical protein
MHSWTFDWHKSQRKKKPVHAHKKAFKSMDVSKRANVGGRLIQEEKDRRKKKKKKEDESVKRTKATDGALHKRAEHGL